MCLTAQTVHQARFEHAHGGAGAKRLDERVLPDAKAHLSRNAPGRTSTSGQDRQHDMVSCKLSQCCTESACTCKDSTRPDLHRGALATVVYA